jgi:hypothetical protein
LHIANSEGFFGVNTKGFNRYIAIKLLAEILQNISIFVYQMAYTMKGIVETTSRQFRERQKDFFDMADNGQKIVIKRGNKQAYVLTPISADDLYFTSEMIARIKESQQEIKEGKSIVLKTKEDLNNFFESL